MKKLSLLNKFLFVLNSILATLLLLSLLLPYISPEVFPMLAVISLLVPFLVAINLLFVMYWLLQVKKQFLLSSIIVFIFWFFSPPIYKFGKSKNKISDGLHLLSYNVRTFNQWKWKKDNNVHQKIEDFIANENPDVVLFQEFYNSDSLKFDFPFHYIKTKKSNDKVGLAIFSKYEIVNSGSFNFKNTSNNIIYGDIVKNQDTIRIYNVHLQSLQINPLQIKLTEASSSKLLQRLENGFSKQVNQAKELISHQKNWNNKLIIAGDFNNTSNSWVYKKLSNDKLDAFIEAGSGFGKTFDYPFPLRIDFILVDDSATIYNYKSEQIPFSDHFPIQSQIDW